MNLKDFIKGLTELSEKYPEALDYDVVTSKDDEGNGFRKVHFSPQVGQYDDMDGDFDDIEGSPLCNAVCVN